MLSHRMQWVVGGMIALSLIAGVSVAVPSMALAHDDEEEVLSTSLANDSEIKAVDEQIKALQKQLDDLKKKRKDLVAAKRGDVADQKKELNKVCRDIRSQLRQGLEGDEVRWLQELLAEDPSVYPQGIINGVFGPLTRAAVIKWQIKNGLPGVGEVGPQTRAMLSVKFKTRCGNVHIPNIPFPMPTTTPTTTPGTTPFKVTVCHKDGTSAGQTMEIPITAVVGHIQHGDKVGACATTNPPADTTAPSISALSATTTTSTATVLKWNTNEAATSKVWYSTTSPVATTSPSVSNSSLVMVHEMPLTGLTASTTYYYMVESKDAAGNASVSGQQSFTTAQ